MVDTDRRPTATSWRALLLRVREALTPEAYERAPDYGPDAPDSDREAWLRQLGRVRDLLEETRAVVAAGGWCGGGAWFTVREPNGTVRPASLAESFALRSPRAQVAGVCLVGIMIRLADDPARVPTTAAVMGGLTLAKVGYDTYLRFIAPLLGILFVGVCGFLALGALTGLG